ncbi:hypothetical protein T11_8936 [Trichinella zimbabwensis]|uniref:Uncharacterized protein n=1 Tax=Trichinella zimbabwensis TaxID=268475 RepID=A0A0V1GYS1_9BILA|nr:hypothetical protein T11_8936 [Trichinella zimbabwensis]
MGEINLSAHSIEQYLLACCNDSSQETDESNSRYGRECVYIPAVWRFFSENEDKKNYYFYRSCTNDCIPGCTSLDDVENRFMSCVSCCDYDFCNVDNASSFGFRHFKMHSLFIIRSDKQCTTQFFGPLLVILQTDAAMHSKRAYSRCQYEEKSVLHVSLHKYALSNVNRNGQKMKEK